MAALRVGPAVPGSLRQINRLTVLRLLRKLGADPAFAEVLEHSEGAAVPLK